MAERCNKKVSCKECKYVSWELDKEEDRTIYACLLNYGKIRKTLKACRLFEAKDETV